MILQMKDIQKSFVHKVRGDLHVLKGISLEVDSGEVVSIIGPSGSGKSTLLRCATFLETIDSGEIRYKDEAAVTTNAQGRAEYVKPAQLRRFKQNFGLVFQQFNLFPHMTVMENLLEAPMQVKGLKREEVEPYARQLLAKVGLSDRADYYPSQLSGGQQQRVAIARMFLKNPPIIFLDEPTASLDAIATEQIKNSIDAIKKDRTVIIISHSISQIIDADYIYALQQGRVEEDGDPDSIYKKGGIYKDIIDASARSLNIEKIARTIDDGKD